MSTVGSLSNARVTGWRRRTGADKEGRPVWSGNQITVPLRCLVSAPTYTQRTTAESEGIGLSSVITLPKRLTITVGDELMVTGHDDLEGKVLVVTKRSTNTKRGLTGLTLFTEARGDT